VIRVYFVFEDPLDDAGVNLSFIDIPTQDPREACRRVEDAARSGELWKQLYPDEQDHPYDLIKMSYLDISTLTEEMAADTVLGL